MFRKPLVNDLLRSLVYCVRTGSRAEPWPIFGFNCPDLRLPRKQLPATFLVAYTLWAFQNQQDERVVVRSLQALKSWTRSLTEQEIAYLQEIFERHYVRT